MKKIISLVLVLALVLVALVACGASANKEKDYTLALAVDTAISKGKVSNTAMALILDADNKIVAARIDTVEAKPELNAEGALVTKDSVTTKVELGAEYAGMNAGSWAEQAKAFENWLVGKTAADVAGTEFTKELIAGCTMTSSMATFKALVAEACASANKVTFKTAETVTLGLAVDAKLTGSVEDGAKVAADFAAVAIAGGKVVASMLDSAEGTYAFTYNEEKEAYDVAATYKGSKNDQGTNYDAFSPMPSGTWYVQAQNFANTTVGKTVAELEGVSTDKIEGSCSIYTGGYKATIIRAAGNAR